MSEWLLPLQFLVNDALKYDLTAADKLSALAGKTLELSIVEPSLTISITIESDGFVLIQQGGLEQFDAQVSGKARDLFAVLQAEDRTAAMMEHQINIQGDTRTFFAIQEVMSHLDIDWEMALADKIGDLPAHFVADALKAAGKFAKNQFKSASRTSRNFLREESNWLVPDSLWDAHRKAIQTTRHDADRINAKIKQLGQRIAAKEAEKKP